MLALMAGLYGGVKTVYRYAVTDNAEDAGMLELALLTNLLYSSDQEDVSCYEDAELRMIFEDLYNLIDERGLNYKYADGNIFTEGHMGDAHDIIKYEVINDVYYRWVCREGIYHDRASDKNLIEFITDLEKPLLHRNWHRLLKNAIREWPQGYMRSIFTASAVLFPVNMLFCVIMYLSGLYFCIRCFVKGRWKFGIPMVLVMGTIVMTVTGVTLTIYGVQRYLTYNLGTFYIAYMILLLQYDKTAKLMKEERV